MNKISDTVRREVFSPDYYQIGPAILAEVGEENEDDMWRDVKEVISEML